MCCTTCRVYSEDVVPQPCPTPVCRCAAVYSMNSVGGAKAVAASLVPEICCNFQVWCFFPSVQAVWGEECFLFLWSLRGDACWGEQGLLLSRVHQQVDAADFHLRPVWTEHSCRSLDLGVLKAEKMADHKIFTMKSPRNVFYLLFFHAGKCPPKAFVVLWELCVMWESRRKLEPLQSQSHVARKINRRKAVEKAVLNTMHIS